MTYLNTKQVSVHIRKLKQHPASYLATWTKPGEEQKQKVGNSWKWNNSLLSEQMSQDRNQEENVKLCRAELIANTTYPNLMGHHEGSSKR